MKEVGVGGSVSQKLVVKHLNPSLRKQRQADLLNSRLVWYRTTRTTQRNLSLSLFLHTHIHMQTSKYFRKEIKYIIG